MRLVQKAHGHEVHGSSRGNGGTPNVNNLPEVQGQTLSSEEKGDH